MQVGGILYDLAKAFDLVYHETWLPTRKLHFYGIKGVRAN
jgi:hypothetical protein